jgi:hypothetical protein
METTLETPTELATLKAQLEEKFGIRSSAPSMMGEWVTKEETEAEYFLTALAEIADEQIERGEYIEGSWHDI